MRKCPKCEHRETKEITLSNFISLLNYKKCFNCRKKYFWLSFLNKNYFLKIESLIK